MNARMYRDPLYGGRHSPRKIVVLCVRWYVAYRLSYRNLVELMAERGVYLAHSTILRSVLHFIPEFVTRWDRHRRPVERSWRANETCIRIKGKWHYLYLAVDKHYWTVDFDLSEQRDIWVAMTFLRRGLASHSSRPPRKITVDGYRATQRAVRLLRRKNPTWRRVVVRSCQHLNTIVEQDHRAIKRRVSAILGVKIFAAAATALMSIKLAHRTSKYPFSSGCRLAHRYGSLAGACALALM